MPHEVTAHVEPPAPAPPTASMAPREHGAWAMLLQPFIGAILVLRGGNLDALAALAAIILLFLMREPLLVLARQQWVWRDPHPETVTAKKRLLLYVGLLWVSGGVLSIRWPPWRIATLGTVAIAFTLFAVYVTFKNRQRSIVFQALSATAMSGTCAVACLAVIRSVPGWAWWWWALHAMHFLMGILVVHVRLDARIAARKNTEIETPEFVAHRRRALYLQTAIAVSTVALFALGETLYAVAILFSSAIHFRDLLTAHRPQQISLPMTVVGQRALAVSIVFTGLLIAAV